MDCNFFLINIFIILMIFLNFQNFIIFCLCQKFTILWISASFRFFVYLNGINIAKQYTIFFSLFSHDDDLSVSTLHTSETSSSRCTNDYIVANQLIRPQENEIIRDRDDEFQMMRHVVLLLFLCGSMIVVNIFL